MSTPEIGPFCADCKHIRADYTCAAFPRGMPDIIVEGHDHKTPVAGDHGIQFEARGVDDQAPAFLDVMLQEAS